MKTSCRTIWKLMQCWVLTAVMLHFSKSRNEASIFRCSLWHPLSWAVLATLSAEGPFKKEDAWHGPLNPVPPVTEHSPSPPAARASTVKWPRSWRCHFEKKLLLGKCLFSLLIRRVAWGTVLFTACAWGSESQYVWPAESEPQLLRLNKASLWCLLSLLASMALQDLPILHFTESSCTSLTALYCCLLQTPLLTVLSCCR